MPSDIPHTLSGRQILVTRPAGQNAGLRAKLETRGAVVYEQPALEICPTSRPQDLDDAIRRLVSTRGAWAIFSSANGVTRTLQEATRLYGDAENARRAFETSEIKIAVVGAATGAAAEEFGLRVALVPDRFVAESIIEKLNAVVDDYATETFFHFTGDLGRDVVEKALRERGARFYKAPAYETLDAKSCAPDVLAALKSGTLDAAVVTSSRSARALRNLLGSDAFRARWVAISPLTATATSELGLEVAAVAQTASEDGLVDALESLFA